MDDMIMEKIDIKKMDDNGLRFSCGNVFPHCRFSLLGGVVVLIAEHVLFPCCSFTVESRILCWAVFFVFFVWLLKFVL